MAGRIYKSVEEMKNVIRNFEPNLDNFCCECSGFFLDINMHCRIKHKHRDAEDICTECGYQRIICTACEENVCLKCGENPNMQYDEQECYWACYSCNHTWISLTPGYEAKMRADEANPSQDQWESNSLKILKN